WSVLFGELLDNGFVLSFFVGIAFWTVAKVRAQGNSRWIALFIILCALMPQFHLSCPIVWAGFLALLWPKRKEIRWSWATTGVFVGLAFQVPYFLYEIQTGWSNLRAYQAEAHGMYYF